MVNGLDKHLHNLSHNVKLSVCNLAILAVLSGCSYEQKSNKTDQKTLNKIEQKSDPKTFNQNEFYKFYKFNQFNQFDQLIQFDLYDILNTIVDDKVGIDKGSCLYGDTGAVQAKIDQVFDFYGWKKEDIEIMFSNDEHIDGIADAAVYLTTDNNSASTSGRKRIVIAKHIVNMGADEAAGVVRHEAIHLRAGPFVAKNIQLPDGHIVTGISGFIMYLDNNHSLGSGGFEEGLADYLAKNNNSAYQTLKLFFEYLVEHNIMTQDEIISCYISSDLTRFLKQALSMQGSSEAEILSKGILITRNLKNGMVPSNLLNKNNMLRHNVIFSKLKPGVCAQK